MHRLTQTTAKRYALTVKDEVKPPNPENGREQSTVSWEYDFQFKHDESSAASEKEHVLDIPWSDFKPTYRGREKKDAGPLKLKAIRGFSFMMRRYVHQLQACECRKWEVS